jgi:hypothetical protein
MFTYLQVTTFWDFLLWAIECMTVLHICRILEEWVIPYKLEDHGTLLGFLTSTTPSLCREGFSKHQRYRFTQHGTNKQRGRKCTCLLFTQEALSLSFGRWLQNLTISPFLENMWHCLIMGTNWVWVPLFLGNAGITSCIASRHTMGNCLHPPPPTQSGAQKCLARKLSLGLWSYSRRTLVSQWSFQNTTYGLLILSILYLLGFLLFLCPHLLSCITSQLLGCQTSFPGL